MYSPRLLWASIAHVVDVSASLGLAAASQNHVGLVGSKTYRFLMAGQPVEGEAANDATTHQAEQI